MIEGIWIFAAMEACRIAVGVFVAIVLVQILLEIRNFQALGLKRIGTFDLRSFRRWHRTAPCSGSSITTASKPFVYLISSQR